MDRPPHHIRNHATPAGMNRCDDRSIMLLCCRGAGRGRATSAKALHRALINPRGRWCGSSLRRSGSRASCPLRPRRLPRPRPVKAEVNERVYRLFGLTREEIALVEEAT